MLLAGRGVAQLGSAPVWGTGGRWFESSHPDQLQFTEAQDRRSNGLIWSFDSRFDSNPNLKASSMVMEEAFVLAVQIPIVLSQHMSVVFYEGGRGDRDRESLGIWGLLRDADTDASTVLSGERVRLSLPLSEAWDTHEGLVRAKRNCDALRDGQRKPVSGAP